MEFLLLLAGLGASFAASGSAQADPEPSDADVGETLDADSVVEEVSPDFDSDNDLIVASDVIDTLETDLTDLVDAGELDQVEADAFLGIAQQVGAPLDIDTGLGSDVVFGSNDADTIRTGNGADVVLGGDGNDFVELGQRNDLYGVGALDESGSGEVPGYASIAEAEGGDDTVDAGSGNDTIFDGYGSNLLEGRAGNDVIDATDQDVLTVDTVRGGGGDDMLTVDQGDILNTGSGSDAVIVDLSEGAKDGFSVVTLNDFNPSEDTLEILYTGSTTGVDVAEIVGIEATPDGTGSVLTVDGVPVIEMKGVTGFSPSSVTLTGTEDNGQDDEIEIFDENDDLLIEDDVLETLEEDLVTLVEAGELTSDEADAIFAAAIDRDGPLLVDTRAGNDVVLGGDEADTILTGDGSDAVSGGAGDDMVTLGKGADLYGFGPETTDSVVPAPGYASIAEAEGGNDTVDAGSGNDTIYDGYGSNLLEGRAGDDVIDATDQDMLSFDTVRGGGGEDVLMVDEGDLLNTGSGADAVIVDLTAGAEDGFALVTINDFNPDEDTLEILYAGSTAGVDVAEIVTVEPNADGSGSILSIDGVQVIEMRGVTDILASDVTLTGTTTGQEPELETLTDADDVVLETEAFTQLSENLDRLVADNALSQEEADDILASVEVRDGPLNVDAADGDNTVVGGVDADTIISGSGSDDVIGGEGDDLITLGKRGDAYGSSLVSVGSDGFVRFDNAFEIDGGNDTVDAGSGNDVLVDFYGQNLLEGRAGNDEIYATDADGVTPDRVLGGGGNDLLIVDEGDVVNTGRGSDALTIQVSDRPVEGYQLVTVNDFNADEDSLNVDYFGNLDTDVDPSTLLSVAANSAGTGSIVSLDGIPVIELKGVTGLSADNINLLA